MKGIHFESNISQGAEGSCYGYQYCCGGGGQGGALFLSTPVIMDACSFRYNVVDSGPYGHDGCLPSNGGGLYFNTTSEMTMTNCFFGPQSGEQIYRVSSNNRLSMMNCTFLYSENETFSIVPGSNTWLVNSIVWGCDLSGNEGFVARYSDIMGGWDGEGNFDLDPLFIAPDDPHLSLGS
ncbi:hypothetical protein JW979_06065, partial [bacterium]|nr:hypothetical protein [candidate division CSSED10-310 bacterium]